MRFKLQNSITLFISIIIIILIFIYFSISISTISLPQDYIEKHTSKISDTVKVFRDRYSIPHVLAHNEQDLLFMMGYLHATDRLWQMELSRRIAAGRLSEILGADMIAADQFSRAIGFKRIALKIWGTLDQSVKNNLESYTKGINYFLETNPYKLPFEFAALNFMPEKWLPSDCISIMRLNAFEMSPAFETDLIFGEIAEKLGIKQALDLLPSYPENMPFVTDDTVHIISKTKKTETDSQPAVIPETMNAVTYDDFNRELNSNKSNLNFSSLVKKFDSFKKNYSDGGSAVGSNAFAINHKLAPNKGALLACDPHATLRMPSSWYQIHLTCPEYNAVGMSIPGIPFLLIGRNDYISWGLADAQIDDCDFFVEKISKDTNQYISPTDTLKFKYVKDTIKIKNPDEKKFIEKTYYLRSTKRSAVLTDFSILDMNNIHSNDLSHQRTNQSSSKYQITISWTGAEPADEIGSLNKIIRAKNWEQFKTGLTNWGAPALNFVFADKLGNIGVQPTGFYPRRQKECRPVLPNPGWLPDFAWEGVSKFQSQEKCFNPKKHYVVAANNPIYRNNYYLSNYWEPASRSKRLDSLLSLTNETLSESDLQRMQNDQLSLFAVDLLKLVVPLLDKQTYILTPMEKEAFNDLKYWDHILSAKSEASSIFNMFVVDILLNTFKDELGEKLYRDFVGRSNLACRKILELLEQEKAAWFDINTTITKESRNEIIIKSFKDAVKDLSELFNDDNINNWQWSKIHKINIRHFLSKNKFFEPALDMGPFEIGGSNTTINNSEFRYDVPFEVVTGATMRFVTDMSDSTVSCVIPGGVSGEPFSPYYSDQLQLFLNGGYVTISSSRIPDEKSRLAIIFKPGK